MTPGAVATLPRGVRLHWDRVRQTHVLLAPERVLMLDEVGHAILSRLDGRTHAALVAALAADFGADPAEVGADVAEFLVGLVRERLVDLDAVGYPEPVAPATAGAATVMAQHIEAPAVAGATGSGTTVGPPIAMLAELTHRCPLSCPYCSNPLDLARRDAEMTAAEWGDVFAQAADLGVLQVHLSGGEPASRRDLEDIATSARVAGLYVNLITSGVGLTPARLERLARGGVDHVQLSVQGTTAASADRIGGYRGGFEAKMAVAGHIAGLGIALTLNAVMHRHNLHELPQVFDLAERLGARRVEVACVQFQGWALRNRAALQPTRDQVDRAKALVAEARTVRQGRIVIDFVPPDYYADLPKACMGGWGTTGLNVAPDGTALPCHAAQTLPGMVFQTVRQARLADIWYRGAAFNAFRGTGWMPAPCRTCERREIDHAGCRCQAMAVLGDAAAPDPVCRRTAGRAVLDAALAAEDDAPGLEAAVWRRMPGGIR